MKKMINFMKKTVLIVAVTLLFGAIIAPTSKVNAAANWWWVSYANAGASGAYEVRAGATSNGAQVKAFAQGTGLGGLWKYSEGRYVSAPNASYTSRIVVYHPQGGFKSR